MSNTFGEVFKVTTFGESHGPAVGGIIDGCPPGLELDVDLIKRDLLRRRTAQSKLVSQRSEADEVEILSGVFQGVTTGTPLAFMVRNTDQKPDAYDHLKDVYRPSHADFTYAAKFGIRDHRGGGRTSARETTSRVIAGSIARQILSKAMGTEILSWVNSIGELTADLELSLVTYDAVEASLVRCPDVAASQAMEDLVDTCRKDGDSVGGTITCRVTDIGAGLGDPVFDRLEATLAKAMLSLPATKGFEIGSGFAGTTMRGSTHNDSFIPDADSPEGVATSTNNSGGVQGGISNGETIYFNVAFKPTATISKAQDTVNTDGQQVTLEAKGRHDPCVLPRAVVMVEAMTALSLLDHLLRYRAVKNLL